MENSALDHELQLSSLPKEKWWGDDCLYNVGGSWFLPQTVQTVNRVINHFKPLPSDILLTSAPKTGTTLLKALVYSIVNRSPDHLATKNPHDLIPFLDFQVYASSNEPSTTDVHSRRIFATHIPYKLLAKTMDSSECQIVYITRNPKDYLISSWHYVNKWDKAKNEPRQLEEAIEKFCLGITPYGPYYDHVLGYRKLSMERPKNVLFLTYEELMEDPKPHVKKIAEFLGCPFQAEEQVEEIVKSCSFEVLSNHEVNKSDQIPTCFPLSPYNSYFRKGVVGDHKNYLTDDIIQRIDDLTKEKFHSVGFMYGI